MRITGGEARGRTINFPSGSKERPTSDFLRETLFNLLGTVQEKSFLDIFAGSGSVGMEALSRGAKQAFFIEKNKKIAAVLQKNANECGYASRCSVMGLDVAAGLRRLSDAGTTFDIVFADPPYNRGLVAQTIKLLRKNSVFHENSVIVIQHSIRENITSPEGEINIIRDQRRYGDNALTFLQMERS